jgi:hypothetical protein
MIDGELLNRIHCGGRDVNPRLIDEYEAGPAKLRKAVAGLSDKQVKTRVEPGKWSILEVVVHLADSDAIAIDRMKRILIEDNPTLLYADETAYVDKLFTHEQSLADALELMEVGRRQWARVLRKLPADAWQRVGTHNKRGKLALSHFVEDYIKHVDHHLTFIEGKRDRLR